MVLSNDFVNLFCLYENQTSNWTQISLDFEIETEDLTLSITRNCETPIERTHTEPRGTPEFKFTKPRTKLFI